MFLKYSLRKNTLFYMYMIFQNYHIKKMTKYNIIIRNSEFSLHKSPPFYFQAKTERCPHFPLHINPANTRRIPD